MSNILRLKYTDKGIGVNFYNLAEEKNYHEIIENIKPFVANDTSLEMSDIKWDLDNMILGHNDPTANILLEKINLRLEQ
ncbi:MAG: hypothetical protein U9N10_11440 [Bacillota bacterium]|nr:hypothetical protein [Bacillota bacterium]